VFGSCVPTQPAMIVVDPQIADVCQPMPLPDVRGYEDWLAGVSGLTARGAARR